MLNKKGDTGIDYFIALGAVIFVLFFIFLYLSLFSTGQKEKITEELSKHDAKIIAHKYLISYFNQEINTGNHGEINAGDIISSLTLSDPTNSYNDLVQPTAKYFDSAFKTSKMQWLLGYTSQETTKQIGNTKLTSSCGETASIEYPQSYFPQKDKPSYDKGTAKLIVSRNCINVDIKH